jgi:hypothetical protein
MFSLLLALLAPEMWFGFSMQIPVFSANNPRENTDLETHATSGCLNISKDVLNAKCLIGVLIKNLAMLVTNRRLLLP